MGHSQYMQLSQHITQSAKKKPMATECTLPQLEFEAFGNRKVVGDFRGAAQFRGWRAAAAPLIVPKTAPTTRSCPPDSI